MFTVQMFCDPTLNAHAGGFVANAIAFSQRIAIMIENIDPDLHRIWVLMDLANALL